MILRTTEPLDLEIEYAYYLGNNKAKDWRPVWRTDLPVIINEVFSQTQDSVLNQNIKPA